MPYLKIKFDTGELEEIVVLKREYGLKQTTELIEVPVRDPGDPVTIVTLREEMSGLTNLVYGAIVASLVSALAAIVYLMQVSKSGYN